MPQKEKETPKIRLEYRPTDQEHEDLKFVYKRYQAMKDSVDRQKAVTMAQKARKQWEAVRGEKRQGDWQSNHIVPMTFSTVETALSEIIDQSIRPKILPRGKEDEPKAKVMQHIYQYTWEVANGDLELYDIIKESLITGTAIAQEYYWKNRRLIQNMSLGKDKKEKVTETEIFDYDDCYMELVRLEDFFIDEKARGFNGPYQARDCIRRYIMNIEDFKRMFVGPIWDQKDNVKYVKAGGDIHYYEFYSPPDGIDKQEDVEVLWYWGRTPKDQLIIVANDVVVKSGPNPYRHKQLPFARMVDVKRTHSFYGKGEAEILESAEDEKTVMRRMIIDRNHLDIDKMFIVSSRLQLNDEDLIARPHGMIPSDDTNVAKPVEYGDMPRSVELSLKYLDDDSVIATGINPRAQSLPTAGSATEAAILKESYLKRIRTKIWLMKKLFLTEVARLRVSNILQFYSQPKLEKIVGDRESSEYAQEVARLKEQGDLVEGENGEMYKKSFKEIRTENFALDTDERGNVTEQSSRGYSFFTLKPEYFVPVARGGYDIRFDAASEVIISEPLQQSKDAELHDRLLPYVQAGIYDAQKVGDMLLKSYKKDPHDVKPDEAIQSEKEARLELAVNLAGMENGMMMKGQEVPPTPNAMPAHSRVHVEFMNSDEFMKLPNESPVIQTFVNHVTGEIMAQTTRSGIPESQQEPAVPGILSSVPEAKPGGAFSGMINKNGGAKDTKMKAGDVIPAMNMGQK